MIKKKNLTLLSIGLVFTLCILCIGMRMISFDLPYEFTKKESEFSIELQTINGGQKVHEEIQLGSYDAWSLIKVKFSSGRDMGIGVDFSSSHQYPDNELWWRNKGEITYLVRAKHPISIFLSYAEWYYLSKNNDLPQYSVSTVVEIVLSVRKSATLPTNIPITTMITAEGYIMLKRKRLVYMTQENQSKLRSIEEEGDLEPLFNCQSCGKQIKFYHYDLNSKYCSNACRLLKDKGLYLFLFYGILIINIAF